MPDIAAGQRIVAELAFLVAGSPVDPTSVRAYVRRPDGTVEVLAYPSQTLIRRDVGQYEAHVLPSFPGTWTVGAEGAGNVDAYDEHTFNVRPSLARG